MIDLQHYTLKVDWIEFWAFVCVFSKHINTSWIQEISSAEVILYLVMAEGVLQKLMLSATKISQENNFIWPC